MRKLRIAQVAAPLLSVPPKTYGGTEKIVSFLTEKLVERGHKVTLYASGDSVTNAKLKSIYPKHKMIWDNPLIQATNVDFAYHNADDFDIIHNHAAHLGIALAKSISTPVVTTLHNSYITPGTPEFKYYKDVCYYVAISKKQMELLNGLKFAGMVYNAIDFSKFKFGKEKKDFYLFLGNITKVKGPDIAVRIAKKMGIKLKFAGKMDIQEQGFFEKEIKPFFDGKNIQYLGMVSDKEKFELMRDAKALVFPLQWEEPFGLIMVEAMLSGTPVVAFNRGSVPEIVKHNETGFVVKTTGEFMKALRKVDRISPETCREWVKSRFSIEKMTDGYERIYEKIVS